jgi:hypothetical protein
LRDSKATGWNAPEGEELVVAQRLEHHPHVHKVLLARLGEDEDVVAVDLDEAPEHGRGRTCRGGRSRRSAAGGVEDKGRAAEDGIHVSHQERRHAVQAERADPEFVLAPRHAEGRLELVLRPDPKLPVRASEVELSEEARSPGLIHQLVHVGQWLDRPLRVGVEPAVVLTGAPRPVRLPRNLKDDRSRARGAGRNDPPLIEQEGHLRATLVELALRPPLHRAGARHWVPTGIDAQLELRPAVRGQAGGSAG